MKKLVVLCVALLMAGLLNQAKAQIQEGIIVQKKGFGNAYYYDGRELRLEEMLYLLESHPEAKKELKIGQRNVVPATILSYVGGFMVGYPIGSQIGGGQPNWAVAGVGAGLLALSLPFSMAVTKHEQHAVQLFNADLPQAAKPKLDLRLGYAHNGASLKLIF